MRTGLWFGVRRSSRTLVSLVVLVGAASVLLDSGPPAAAEEEATEVQSSAAAASSESQAEREADEPPASDASAGVLRLFGLGDLFGSDSEPPMEDAALALVGSEAPTFELESPDGETVRLENLRGRVVVLDFWATWCGPCMLAMPELQKVHEAFADQPVTVLGVNQADELDAIRETLKEKKLSFGQVLDDGTVAGLYNVSGIPQTVLIDAEGIVQAVHVGYSPQLQATLTEQINKLLAGESVYDPAQIAEAQARREQQQEEVRRQVGLHHPERLTRLDESLTDPAAMIETDYRPAQWVQLPGEEQRSLVLVSSENRLAIVRPAPDESETIDLQWSAQIGTWDFCPTFHGDQARWTVLGAEYDDQYNIKQLTLALFGSDGKPVWTRVYPTLPGDSNPNVDVTSGDLTGDDRPEIALLVEHDGLGDAGITGPDGSTRLLSVYDYDGELLVRGWIPGYGGSGLHVFPGPKGNTLLIATNEGLTRFRIEPDESSTAAEAVKLSTEPDN